MLAALALCAVLLVSLVPAARAAQADGQLQFDENGEFRILIVADTQDIDKPQKETIALLEAELDAAQPDLCRLPRRPDPRPVDRQERGTHAEGAGRDLAAGRRAGAAVCRRLRQS